MEEHGGLDPIDRGILRILSLYRRLSPLELWYELGEDDSIRERVTELEIRGRLDSLKARGLVEPVAEAGNQNGLGPLTYRVTTTELH
jgi:hypothetical protein